MRRLVVGLSMLIIGASAIVAGTPAREVRARSVAVGGTLPADLVAPEGKTRWHLESVPLAASRSEIISREDFGFKLDWRRPGAVASEITRVTGADSERWLLPDRDAAQLKMGFEDALRFDETRDWGVDRITAHVATVGIGWLHLPSGPREVVLQRALVEGLRAKDGAASPDQLVHRWIDPRAGVVAEVAGPASSDGRSRLAIDQGFIVEEVLLGAGTMKIYVDQLARGTFQDILYQWDRGPGRAVSSLVPNPGIGNMCDLVNLNAWDFSANTSGKETVTTAVHVIPTPATPPETCNATACGYSVPNGELGREDRDVTGTLRKDNQVTQVENRAADVTIWLRAAAQNEGVAGAFGSGESRLCYMTDATGTRSNVPLWRFGHNDNDGNGYYFQPGDLWAGGPFTCEQNIFNQVCGMSGFADKLYMNACGNHKGNQRIEVIKGGVVTLPSGHTLNALVARNTADFCVYTVAGCNPFFKVDEVRTVLYLWQVPYLGTLVLLRGPQNLVFAAGENAAPATATPCTNFTTVDFTSFSFGLFPPVSITTGAVTGSSVALSWNPGNDLHRINGYKIYWDTDSGSSSSYAFDSVTNAASVAFSGASATISGLSPGTQYYFTVTSLSDYTDPSTNRSHRYESLLYPTTVSGDPSFSYPVEVTATTAGGGCTPSQAVANLTVSKAGANVHVCWTATSDPCAIGYDVLGSGNVTSDVGWSVVGQVGLTTCWDGNPTGPYLLVRSRGTGGNGPWGHYGH